MVFQACEGFADVALRSGIQIERIYNSTKNLYIERLNQTDTDAIIEDVTSPHLFTFFDFFADG